jgi:predicted glycosyltransferase
MAEHLPAGKTVLVAPLDWGLGHATRCIPVVNALVANGCKVVLAASGPQAALLSEAFPALEMIDLQGYGIAYSRKAGWWKIMSQLPKIAAAIRLEHQWLEQLLQQRHFDAVIADNRYGLYSHRCHTVLITHQLQPALPAGWGWSLPMARRVFQNLINRFSECWIPDVADPKQGLSGDLGHPEMMPTNHHRYVGWLTRFEPAPHEAAGQTFVLALLSGPEPQRTLLEEKIAAQLPVCTLPVMLVRGLPDNASTMHLPSPHQAFNHLNSVALQKAMQQAAFVICRGGYSTLMDAFTLQKKLIVVPTPGQTEQQYLAEKLAANGAVMAVKQDDFQLNLVIQSAEKYSFRIPAVPQNELQQAVYEWLQTMTTS